MFGLFFLLFGSAASNIIVFTSSAIVQINAPQLFHSTCQQEAALASIPGTARALICFSGMITPVDDLPASMPVYTVNGFLADNRTHMLNTKALIPLASGAPPPVAYGMTGTHPYDSGNCWVGDGNCKNWTSLQGSAGMPGTQIGSGLLADTNYRRFWDRSHYCDNTNEYHLYCGVYPTLAPTSQPTINPTTISPTTVNPTTQTPTSAQPTANPTTGNPTSLSPTSVSPTTSVPTTFPTTHVPTLSPTSISPTHMPTTTFPTSNPSTIIPTTTFPTSNPSTVHPTNTRSPSTVHPTNTPTSPSTNIPTTQGPGTTRVPTSSKAPTGSTEVSFAMPLSPGFCLAGLMAVLAF